MNVEQQNAMQMAGVLKSVDPSFTVTINSKLNDLSDAEKEQEFKQLFKFLVKLAKDEYGINIQFA